MTEGDYDDDGPATEPLKVARLRLGWSQAAAMRRFQDAVTRHGASAPSGASLKRMFAYWEAGERALSDPACRLAFVDIDGAPPEVLGLAPRRLRTDSRDPLQPIRTRPHRRGPGSPRPKAEALAAAGRADAARRRIDQAQDLLSDEGSDELPYLMLTEEHLARWRCHCLARLGDPEAVVALPRARAAEGDSVRAATSLHADLALALLHAGSLHEAGQEARLALEMAQRYGSARQRNRLLAILARSEGEVLQQPDQGP